MFSVDGGRREGAGDGGGSSSDFAECQRLCVIILSVQRQAAVFGAKSPKVRSKPVIMYALLVGVFSRRCFELVVP